MLWKKIMDISLNRGFFYLSNPIYNPTSGFYDYGPIGSLLREKIISFWRREFIKTNGFYEINSSIITPEIVLKASGHLDHFTDPVVICDSCNAYYRADHLAKEQNKDFKWDGNLDSLKEFYLNHTISCKECGSRLTKIEVFNLMFSTIVGKDKLSFLRPETAQGIYTSFINIFRSFGSKLPLGVGQVGKSFRNEISPRNALVRMREFTQMELEVFFYKDDWDLGNLEHLEINYVGSESQLNEEYTIKKVKIIDLIEEEGVNKIFLYFLAKEWLFYKKLGMNMDKCYFRYQLKDERPHYSKANIDLEIKTSYGNIEVVGNANRGNFDLSQHAKYSGKDLSVFLQEENKKIVPNVFEVSIGLDRTIFSLLEHSFMPKTNAKDWDWFAFPPHIAPFHVAVFPLMKKKDLVSKSLEVYNLLKQDYDVFYYKSGSIGKRYAKSDEIGIPYAITIDYTTLEDNSVTIRYRDNGKQERIDISKLKNKIEKNILSGKTNL